jgi:hypothetical protein
MRISPHTRKHSGASYRVGRVTVTFSKSVVTGSNDAILSEAGWTTAVPLVLTEGQSASGEL